MQDESAGLNGTGGSCLAVHPNAPAAKNRPSPCLQAVEAAAPPGGVLAARRLQRIHDGAVHHVVPAAVVVVAARQRPGSGGGGGQLGRRATPIHAEASVCAVDARTCGIVAMHAVVAS